MSPDEQGVTYTNKELFEKIDKNISDVKTLLETKADEVDVIALRAKVQILDADVAVLKDNKDSKRWQVANIVLPVLAIIVAIAALFLR